jgi:hypothetical protein
MTEKVDHLVPDPQVEREFSITSMTLWRWTRDPTLGFPEKISIRGRNYRSRRQLDDFKAKLLARALKSRSDRGAWTTTRPADAQQPSDTGR